MNLKALQKKWYKRLKSEGFCDIEDPKQNRFVDPQNPISYYRRFGPKQFNDRAEYYSRASQFLHEYRFKTRTEKQVWHYHSEGFTLREIANKFEMTLSGGDLSVYSMIKRLKEIMRTWEFESE